MMANLKNWETIKDGRCSVVGLSITWKDDYIGLVIFIQPETINISYLGNYFVSEQYRGKGIGGRIWKLMMEHTDNSRVVVLGSFEAMVPKYRARDTPVPGTILERIHGDTARLK
uniref:N-acetyltransferase domain-containing protein n=1 Tax=Plectus sambesii TaxID=2011161 RepID=A0A914V7T0_9BILA